MSFTTAPDIEIVQDKQLAISVMKSVSNRILDIGLGSTGRRNTAVVNRA